MSLSVSIHGVTAVTAGPVHHSNANQISLRIQTTEWDGHEATFEIALFNLPTDAADHLARALSQGAVYRSEEEVRADERRKIATKLGL